MKNFDSTKKFLNRLVHFGKITERDYDAELGKQCGYKKCCIDYYIRLKSYGLPPGLITDIMFGYDHCDYVRCPKCRKIDLSKENPYGQFDSIRLIYQDFLLKNKVEKQNMLEFYMQVLSYDHVFNF